jgi:hypothetical protein
MREAIPPLPNTSAWRGAELSTGAILSLQAEFKANTNHPLKYAVIYHEQTTMETIDKGKAFHHEEM